LAGLERFKKTVPVGKKERREKDSKHWRRGRGHFPKEDVTKKKRNPGDTPRCSKEVNGVIVSPPGKKVPHGRQENSNAGSCGNPKKPVMVIKRILPRVSKNDGDIRRIYRQKSQILLKKRTRGPVEKRE